MLHTNLNQLFHNASHTNLNQLFQNTSHKNHSKIIHILQNAPVFPRKPNPSKPPIYLLSLI